MERVSLLPKEMKIILKKYKRDEIIISDHYKNI
jgi:hypothetical protein